MQTAFRKKSFGCFVAVAALGILALPIRSHAQAFSGSGSLPNYTAAQAERGKAAYSSSCKMCHSEDLNGGGSGPSLTDTAFGAQWHDQSPSALFAYIATQMPPTARGSLGNKTYADIVAYIFQANGFKPGETEFSPTAAVAAATTNDAGGAPPGARPRGAGPAPAFAFPVKHDAVFNATVARQRAELEKITPVTDEMLRHPPDADWLIWRRIYAGLGHSPLRQINKNNVNNLGVAWTWSLPVNGNETTPLVHDGVIFVKSGNQVDALDGVTGDSLWQYIRPYPEWMHRGGTEIVKNLAIYQDKLYVPFLDGHMLALDVKTGKVVWDHVIVGPQEAASRLPGPFDSPDAQHFLMVADSGPLVAQGEVVVGLAGCSNDYKGGCFILGLNAQTGEEDWRFNTIARPGQPGGDSWNGAPVDERFGSSVWITGSYDPDLNLLYFGTGQTYKNSTLLSPQAQKGESNDALYTDSTVALAPETGKLVWYYQHFPADVWDLDWAFEQMLVDFPVEGKPRKLVVTAGKIAIFDALDRTNGQYVFSKGLDLQNIVTSIDPVTGKKTIDPKLLPAPHNPNRSCPYARDEPATAFDPGTKIVYVPVLDDSCPDPDGKFDGKFGRLEALNLETGKVVWMQRRRSPEISSVLVTDGGIVFDGSMDRGFRASDAQTGKILWETRLNNAPKSSPITYSVNGVQYVAVITGGVFENIPRPGITPEIATPAEASTLWIFKLPGKIDATQ